MAGSSSTTSTRGPCSFICSARWQSESCFRSTLSPSPHLDLATVSFYESFTNREPQASSSRHTGYHTAVKLVEDTLQVPLRNSLASVANGQMQTITLHAGFHLNRRIGPGVFHRILQKVYDHLHN